jgi:hypothetical protein
MKTYCSQHHQLCRMAMNEAHYCMYVEPHAWCLYTTQAIAHQIKADGRQIGLRPLHEFNGKLLFVHPSAFSSTSKHCAYAEL